MEMRCMQTPNASVMRKIAHGETTGAMQGKGHRQETWRHRAGRRTCPPGSTARQVRSHLLHTCVKSTCHARMRTRACARPSPARVRVCAASYPVSCSTVKKEKKRLLLALELEPFTLPGNRDSICSST